ncbi:SprT family zinc-dependent metalloprotease [Clostridium sp. ATCC 25772]|uniref:M48 family metallopeptidase n=1 Tax=Clostridium sp. ATCC 25772 TaxID=1676991 RepID=UPI0007821C3B|nr:SprT family zinc-dependent metalloprotease [Clostridium sp. ATCC 25772]
MKIDELDIEIIYRERKSICIRIQEDNKIKILVPNGISDKTIYEVVEKKLNWIEGKIKRNRQRMLDREVKYGVDGEKYPYLGELYTLKIILDKKGKNNLRIEEKEIILNCKDLNKTKYMIEKFYRKLALDLIEERVKIHSERLKLSYGSVKVRTQKRRWASCTYNNDLIFNWKCIMAPLDVIDYIVIHELCHTVHKNHSAKYWCYVREIMPNYKEKELWLKDNGYKLELF